MKQLKVDVRYKGCKYKIGKYELVRGLLKEEDKEIIADEIQNLTGVKVGCQRLTFGTIPFEKVSGSLPDKSTFLLRSVSGKLSHSRLPEVVVKDGYDNEYYLYVERGTSLSDLKSQLFTNYGISGEIVSRHMDGMYINKNTTLYSVPEDCSVLFIITTSTFSEPQYITYCVTFNEDTTVSDIKEQLANKTGFNTKGMRLRNRNGEVLEDDNRVYDNYKDLEKCTADFGWGLDAEGLKPSGWCYWQRLGKSMDFGGNVIFGMAGCSAIAYFLSARAYIPNEIMPSIKVCIAASVVTGVLSGVIKYNLDKHRDENIAL